MAGTSRTWEPDIELSLDRAHAIIGTRFPAYSHKTPRKLGEGWDNLCFVYPDGMVFRMPTRAPGAALVGTETAVLPVLNASLPLPVPAVEFIGEPGEDYPYSFFGYRQLPGQTADRCAWTDAERTANVETLAHFLSALHSLPVNQTPFAELPDDRLFRKDPATQVQRIERRLEELSEHDLPVNPGQLRGWAKERADSAKPSPRLAVVHGDLYPRHLLVENGHVTGVIDWGDVHRGHPAIDLSLAYTFVPVKDRARFFELYGLTITEDDDRLAQLRAAMYGTALLAYGLDVRDDAAAGMGSQILINLPLQD